MIAQIFFELGGRKSIQRPDIVFIGVAIGDGARYRAIDAFLGNINPSEQVQLFATCLMGLDEGRNPLDRREIVVKKYLIIHSFQV